MQWDFLSKGWDKDGHPHERDESGFCGSCGARSREPHYRLVAKEQPSENPDTPNI